MPILRPCLDCGTLVQGASRCKQHAQQHADWLLGIEPWRKVYDTNRWKDLTAKIKRRDGYRCMYTVRGRRCANTSLSGTLSVHHLTKLRLIWSRLGEPRPGAANWSLFLEAAHDPASLVTLCNRHHYLADSNTIGDPAYRASATARKVRQHFKRHQARDKPISYVRDKRKDWE